MAIIIKMMLVGVLLIFAMFLGMGCIYIDIDANIPDSGILGDGIDGLAKSIDDHRFGQAGSEMSGEILHCDGPEDIPHTHTKFECIYDNDGGM